MLRVDFRSKGIEVAIDDAGSGYASLEAIAALATDYLKVTKGLVSTLAREPIKQDLVKMLVELAGKINARTIAEGIETPEEYETCRELGIDLLQGYFLAHPQEQLRAGDAEVAQSVGELTYRHASPRAQPPSLCHHHPASAARQRHLDRTDRGSLLCHQAQLALQAYPGAC